MRENRATILSTEEKLKTCHIPNFAAHIPRFITKQTKVIVFVHFCFRQFFGLALQVLAPVPGKKTSSKPSTRSRHGHLGHWRHWTRFRGYQVLSGKSGSWFVASLNYVPSMKLRAEDQVPCLGCESYEH